MWRRGVRLLDQQLWLFGCDIRRPERNALLEYGFDRVRPPRGADSSSCYSLRGEGFAVQLRGFALCYGEASLGGLCIRRYGFEPLIRDDPEPPEPLWSPDAACALYRPPLGDFETERARALAAGACSWVAAYERWALRSLGLAHRSDSLAAWRMPVCPADGIAAAWESLARELEAGMGGVSTRFNQATH